MRALPSGGRSASGHGGIAGGRVARWITNNGASPLLYCFPHQAASVLLVAPLVYSLLAVMGELLAAGLIDGSPITVRGPTPLLYCLYCSSPLAAEFLALCPPPVPLTLPPSSGLFNQVTGKSVADNISSERSRDPAVIRTAAQPLRPNAGFRVLSGNLFDSALMKTSVISADFTRRCLFTPFARLHHSCSRESSKNRNYNLSMPHPRYLTPPPSGICPPAPCAPSRLCSMAPRTTITESTTPSSQLTRARCSSCGMSGRSASQVDGIIFF